MYFTDPYYKRLGGMSRKCRRTVNTFMRFVVIGSRMERIEASFKQPNGIVGDADRSLLFVADIGDHKTYVFRINEAGGLRSEESFATRVPMG